MLSEALAFQLHSDWPFMTALVNQPSSKLKFHDKICTGGCDGCLNLDNPDNAGLSDLIDSLETVYQEQGYSDILSRST